MKNPTFAIVVSCVMGISLLPEASFALCADAGNCFALAHADMPLPASKAMMAEPKRTLPQMSESAAPSTGIQDSTQGVQVLERIRHQAMAAAEGNDLMIYRPADMASLSPAAGGKQPIPMELVPMHMTGIETAPILLHQQ